MPSFSYSLLLPSAQRATLQRMAGRRGLNGPIVLCLVGGASSSVGALVTVSITTVRAPLCRPATATSRSVTSAVSNTKYRSTSTGHITFRNNLHGAVVLVLLPDCDAVLHYLISLSNAAVVQLLTLCFLLSDLWPFISSHQSSRTAAGVIGHPGHPAQSPVVLVSSLVSAFATPQPPSSEAKSVRERVGKLKNARNLRVPVSFIYLTSTPWLQFLVINNKDFTFSSSLFQSVVTGDPGHPGIHAPSPVEVVSRLVSACATIRLHRMVVKSVLVMP